ncbi:YceD family protein [Bradyrhizobium sp. HKCCYLS1011]|uniref:YceD family protein n=1 Tax=Bradyrhizobium sp. HKCCYLS1011 TaxID=3420733 RepID=UPI003EB72587
MSRRDKEASRDAIRDPVANPWRAPPVIVAQIPEAGLHREIEADQATREGIAGIADLPEVISAHASFDVTLKRDGKVHVEGRVQARVGQICVVTLDPIESEIDEPIDQMFAPPEQIPELSDMSEDDGEGDADVPDPPEPIVNGQIDLARLATDALFLGIDPYPRKPGAVFEQAVAADDPQDHPFAALKSLKPGNGQGGTGPQGSEARSEGTSKGKLEGD